MISDKYKSVFVHIPKTGGQSVEDLFLRLHGLTWETRAPLLLRFNPDPSSGPERLAHLTANEYLAFNYLDKTDFQSYFKFSFVRNPWSRLVSDYRYRQEPGFFSFREFVTKRLPERDSYSDSYRHIMPQCDFLYDTNGRQLVDFIGKTENIAEDFSVVAEKLRLPEISLPHLNSSGDKRHYSTYYDYELVELVGNLYAEDVKRFNYTFNQ
jgi:hypothetical protein